jgi:hypothetical protein
LEGKKLKILKKVLGSHYKSGEETLFFCPKCKHHKKKLSVNVDADKFKCWICEYAGHSLRRVLRDYGDIRTLCEWDGLTSRVDINSFEDLFKEEVEEEEQRIFLPEEFCTLTGRRPHLNSLAARKYLSDRNITSEDIVAWKMGHCISGQYEGRIIIPSFSVEGVLNYFVARSYNNNWKKYMNPPASRNIIFNNLMVDWDSDIILVEGVFDAIRAGQNAIPLLGSQLNENSKLFQEIVRHNSRVYLALDPDAEKKSAKLIKKMLTYGIELYKIEIVPYSDLGEMPKDEFFKRKEQAKPVSSSFGDFFRYLLERTVKI